MSVRLVDAFAARQIDQINDRRAPYLCAIHVHETLVEHQLDNSVRSTKKTTKTKFKSRSTQTGTKEQKQQNITLN